MPDTYGREMRVGGRVGTEIFMPGNRFRRENMGIHFVVVLLSQEPGSPWVCGEFQQLPDGSLLGAQIVTYDESELAEMLRSGDILSAFRAAVKILDEFAQTTKGYDKLLNGLQPENGTKGPNTNKP